MADVYGAVISAPHLLEAALHRELGLQRTRIHDNALVGTNFVRGPSGSIGRRVVGSKSRPQRHHLCAQRALADSDEAYVVVEHKRQLAAAGMLRKRGCRWGGLRGGVPVAAQHVFVRRCDLRRVDEVVEVHRKGSLPRR